VYRGIFCLPVCYPKSVKIKIYTTIILPVVLYGCETWLLTLREERRLRVLEKRVLRRIFGPKRDEVTVYWRKLHNEELNDLYFFPLALQPAVGFGLSNNTSPFVPIYHQLSPSSHSQHFKISFHFFCPSFPGSSSSSRPFQFLSEYLFGHPILHSLRVTQLAYPLPLYPFYYIFSFIQLF